jgi:hypothetical protein
MHSVAISERLVNYAVSGRIDQKLADVIEHVFALRQFD